MDIFRPGFGAAQRSNLLLNALSHLGHVDVIMFRDCNAISNVANCDIIFQRDVNGDDNMFKRRMRQLKCFFFDSFEVFSMIDRSKEKVVDSFVAKKQYDYIVTRYIPDAVNSGLLKYSRKLIVDMDDNPVSVMQRGDLFKSGSRIRNWITCWLRSHEIESSKRLLSKICGKVGFVFASNIDDVDHGIIYLPNIPFYEIDSNPCSFDETNLSLLFVGLLDYEPNYQGVKHFLDNILPLIRVELPMVDVSIVGKASKCNLDSWKNDPRIHFKGYVPDLNEEYKRSRVVIVPCYAGAGTNIKVLEAMRYKRPCVTTVVGARGYARFFHDKTHYLVSTTDMEFAHNVILMLMDEAYNHEISNNANRAVNTFFSKSAFNDIVVNTILNK